MNHSQSKVIGLFWIVGAFLFVSAFVVGLPLLASSVPWSYEKRISDYIGALPMLEACDSGSGSPAFKKIISRLHPLMEKDAEIPIEVQVVKGDAVNAFASLGAKIYVYEGLLKQAQSAEEIAGVLAHEIEHVRHRHVLQGVFVRVLTVEAIHLALGQTGGMDPQLFNMILNLHYGREQEEEADLEGLRRLSRAKIDVSGFRRFFERETGQSTLPAFFSDHPAPENRAEMTRQFDGSPIVPILSNEEWRALKSVCK